MRKRAFARIAACGCLVVVSPAALAQEGPATRAPASAPNPPSAPLPALPAPTQPAATQPATIPPATAPTTTWAPSSGVDLHLDGRALHVRVGPAEAVLDLGCTGRSTLQTGDRAFVACGADGVIEVDLANPLAPRRAGAMPVDGEATALFLRDGQVWVEIAHYFARPVRTDGVVDVPGRREVAALQTGDALAGGPPTVVGPPSPSLMAPPRRGGLWELSAEVGAFVNLGPSSGGVVGWASAVYRFDLPIVVRLELAPIAFAAGNGITTVSSEPSSGTLVAAGLPTNVSTGSNPGSGSIAVGSVQALVGVDTQFVEVAIGGGAATLSNPSGTGSVATGGSSIATEARFGAHDGLAITLESIVVSANGQFALASFVTTVQVPLTPTVMLVARGGGGNMGVLFGDLGARVLLAGDGGRGTVALTGFFGGEGIDFQGCSSDSGTSGGGAVATCPYASLGGPSVGGGIEWRR